jgi:hypothetical protein
MPFFDKRWLSLAVRPPAQTTTRKLDQHHFPLQNLHPKILHFRIATPVDAQGLRALRAPAKERMLQVFELKQ